MTLTELRYIIALAQERNFSRAAERCAVSQPSLSVAISRLEDELGVMLFERGKGFVTPTAVGEQIVGQARRAVHEAEEVRNIALRGKNPLEGELRLGVIHTVAPYLLPGLVQSLRGIAPNMPLQIEESMTTVLAEMLQANKLDAVIIALPFALPGIVCLPLYDEVFKVVVPKGHPLEAKSTLLPEDLSSEDVLLLKAGNCFRDQVLGACPQISSDDSGARLGHSIGTIRSMVASGLGVSVLPEGSLGHPYDNELISVIPFAEPEPSRRIALAWRVGFVRPKALDAMIQAVRQINNPAFHLVK